MPNCFVIQPFDRGTFDARYNDVFEPAISAAGYTAYRVDRDPSVSIPIEDITSKIEAADACFVEITLNNPNVWFELGYALASRKEVCLVCSTERQDRFPFDVQHRSIITYNVRSISDFDAAKKAICDRLSAIATKVTVYERLEERQPVRPLAGLTHSEICCLCAILESRQDPSRSVPIWMVLEEMGKMGFNKLAIQLAIHKLEDKKYLIADVRNVYDEEERSNYDLSFYNLSKEGMSWMVDNEGALNTASVPK